MVLSDDQKQKLKGIQIEMLKHFIEICEKENLQYFLIGGTALGAVRHKGFIPWDDDIDVGLPRKYYEKFINVAQKYLPEYYFIQNIYTDPDYPNNFSKMRYSGSTFIEKSCQNIKMNHGIYIDIFPLDGYTDINNLQKKFELKKKLLTIRINQVFDLELKKISLRNKLISFLLRIVYPDYRVAVKKREQLYKTYKYEDCEYVANHGGAWGQKEIMLKSCFGKGTMGEFEGMKVMIPEKYDQYLKNVYGDYMTLPPVEKRIGHHYCTVIDFEKPYTEYVKE